MGEVRSPLPAGSDGLPSSPQTPAPRPTDAAAAEPQASAAAGPQPRHSQQADGGPPVELAWRDGGLASHVDWPPGADWVVDHQRLIKWQQGDAAFFPASQSDDGTEDVLRPSDDPPPDRPAPARPSAEDPVPDATCTPPCGTTIDICGEPVAVGALAVDGGLLLDRGGVLTLAGNEDYSGPTIIESGTLVLPSGVALGDDASAVLPVAAGRTLELDDGTETLRSNPGSAPGERTANRMM